MTEKEQSEQKAHKHEEECCGGHCESQASSAEHDESQGDQSSKENHPGQHEFPIDEAAQTANHETDWKMQAAYLAAEIENMQKRFMREASDIRKYANEDLLKKVCPILDTLVLALSAAEKAKKQAENEALFSNKVFLSFIQGVEMTAKNFEQVLQSCGVEFIDSVGKAFDPTLHEALGQSKVEGIEDNIITEEFQRGLRLGGRIVRPAKVIVNKV